MYELFMQFIAWSLNSCIINVQELHGISRKSIFSSNISRNIVCRDFAHLLVEYLSGIQIFIN